jgi:hypothetical protein
MRRSAAPAPFRFHRTARLKTHGAASTPGRRGRLTDDSGLPGGEFWGNSVASAPGRRGQPIDGGGDGRHGLRRLQGIMGFVGARAPFLLDNDDVAASGFGRGSDILWLAAGPSFDWQTSPAPPPLHPTPAR